MPQTILVVEDEPYTLRFLTVVLEEEGYVVLTARDGGEAVRMLGQDTPDLLLSDIMMPVMDGIRLCNFVQNHPIYRTIPIVLMSAFVEPLANTIQPTAYLPKPFTLDRLCSVLETTLAAQPRKRG